jgi:hypothetical protein
LGISRAAASADALQSPPHFGGLSVIETAMEYLLGFAGIAAAQCAAICLIYVVMKRRSDRG